MSNRLCIQPTIFEDVPSGEKSYGVRVYDDYAQAYDNTWKKLPEDNLKVLLKVVKSDNEDIQSMLQSVRDSGKGLYIGSQWYQNQDIREYLK